MRAILAPLALIYAIVHSLRRKVYSIGLLRAQRLNKPVISVGNLTVGGTGKTPFVDALLTQLEGRGLKCGVLTRGYGRKQNKTLLINSATTVEEAGDEPLWLFMRHPQAKIAVGPDRAASSKLATDVDLYILDDGLQHLSIHRDFEITLIDATRPLWHYRPLPMGYGRDNFGVLRRSDLVVITRSGEASPDHLDKIADKIFNHGALDVIESSLERVGWVDLRTSLEFHGDQNKPGKSAALISGIGNPESFEAAVKNCDINVKMHLKKPDHWNYTAADLEEIEKKAIALKADLIVTTEKDAIKIQKIFKARGESKIPWSALIIKMTFDPEMPDIHDLVSHSNH